MSIRGKLLSSISAILIVAFVTMSLVNYMFTREAVRAELLNSSLPLTGKNIYSEIHTAMMRPILVSSSMANDTFLRGWVKEGEHGLPKIMKYLDQIQEEYHFLTAFFVSFNTDNYYYPGGILKKVHPREPRDVWYYSFLRSGHTYDLNVDYSLQDNDALSIFINYRLEDEDGTLLGVVGVGVNMDNAISLLQNTKEKYGREVYLVDNDGWIQVHPNKSLIQQAYITEAPGISDISQKILRPRTETTNFEYDRPDGTHILLATHYIPEFSWHLIVEQDEDRALATARDNLYRTLVVGFFVSMLIIVLCAFTINHFQRRLERLATTDPLTGAANRRVLEQEYTLAQYKIGRDQSQFAIAILDLDNFKAINDEKGHLAGDKILRTVSETISANIRPTDLLARWGGDEFVILLSGTQEHAQALMGRIREALKTSCDDTPIPFSCGITEVLPGEELDVTTARADKAMYAAKVTGNICKIAG